MTVVELYDWLHDAMLEPTPKGQPELSQCLVALSRDPEGNGYALLAAEMPAGFHAIGTVEDARTYDGTISEYEGKPVMVLWPGYPEFESIADLPDDTDCA
jgi:hypothetical protein